MCSWHVSPTALTQMICFADHRIPKSATPRIRPNVSRAARHAERRQNTVTNDEHPGDHLPNLHPKTINHQRTQVFSCYEKAPLRNWAAIAKEKDLKSRGVYQPPFSWRTGSLKTCTACSLAPALKGSQKAFSNSRR